MRWQLILFCLICPFFSSLAQTALVFTVQESDGKAWGEHGKYRRQHPDSASAWREVKNVVETLRNHAFLTASADRIEYHRDTLRVNLHIGPAYLFALAKGNAPDDLLRESGYKSRDGSPPLFVYPQWVRLSEKMLSNSEKKGYPFASLKLDSIQINDDHMQAQIHYQSGPIILFDSLLLTGNSKVKAKFLATYLNILPRQPYNQDKLPQANRLLAQLPYLKLRQPTSVRFFEEKAYVKVEADYRKTNQFDGIVGFLPNQNASDKLLITGDVKLRLNNLFGVGRSIHFQWQQIRPASPVLYLEYVHPVLFGTRLELKAHFNLLKQDSSFLNVDRKLTLAYLMGGAGKVSTSVGLRTSNLSNGAQYKEETRLPIFSDVSYTSYGLGFERSTLDDYFYPRRGFRLNVQGEVGNRRIIQNPFLDQQLYEGLSLTTLQASLRAVAQQYITLSGRSVLLLKGQAAKMVGPHLFYNDLFRLGGLNSLRGFNENAFFASAYSAGTVEYHFFTDESSYLLICYDQAWFSTQTVQGERQDTPFGLGTGISFSTKAGAFNLIYSMGRSADQKFGLAYSKIHLGFVSIF
jgi:translocation and assembly module TamA